MRRIAILLVTLSTTASSFCAVPKKVNDWDLGLLQASTRRMDALIRSCERVGGNLETTDEVNAFTKAFQDAGNDLLDATAYLYRLRTSKFFETPIAKQQNGAFVAEFYIQRYVSDCLELTNDFILWGRGFELVKSRKSDTEQEKMLASQTVTRLYNIKLRMALIKTTLVDLLVFDIFKPKKVGSVSKNTTENTNKPREKPRKQR